LDVLEKSIWAGKTSKGTFDITFASMSDLWKFGDAAEANPKLPSAAEIEKRRKLIDYRKIELDEAGHRARIAKGQRIDVGGIAKGYAVDGAAKVLKKAEVTDFLVQAGGDLFGSGKKPDGSPWVSGIRDPRGPATSFFATIELTDHAFSTAGDYARSFMLNGKRYHHIIDPRTGWPATACRSVTLWAGDAFTADAVDDAVFILGPKEGLELVESLPDVGAVIVDAKNEVHVSKRLEGKVKILKQPTDGI
jgi:thiamine biosynthesis lipoprotein